MCETKNQCINVDQSYSKEAKVNLNVMLKYRTVYDNNDYFIVFAM